MLRLFVAIELPIEVQKALENIQEATKKYLENARWVEAKNLHLTLQFLGNCPEEQVKKIAEQLTSAGMQTEPFFFQLQSLGGFPSNKNARIFWVGVGQGREEVCRLQGIAEKALSPLGFKEEKREFHPHITLARLKKPESLQLALEAISEEDIYSQPIKVDSISLFESRLHPTGAQYFVLEKFFLKRA